MAQLLLIPIKTNSFKKTAKFYKMKMKLRNLFLLLFILPVSMVSAQTNTWSLEKCISHALQNNIQIKQRKLTYEFNENNHTQSRMNFLPSINAGADQNYNWGRSVDPYTNEFSTTNVRSNNFYITASVTLFNGFQTANTYKQSEYNMKASLQEYEKAKNDISLNIATAYLQILYYQDLVEIAKNQLDLTKQQIERTKKLVEVGTLARGNLLEIQAQAANEELQLINAQNQLTAAILTLRQLLDLKADSTFVIERPVFPDMDIALLGSTVEQVYNQALNLPQIKSVEYQLKAAEKSHSIAMGGISPKLTLSASYYTGYSSERKRYYYGDPYPKQIGYVYGDNRAVFTEMVPMLPETYPFWDQFKDNANKSVRLQLTIPIFNNWQHKTNISNSKISILDYQFRVQLAKDNLYKDIQQSYSDAIAALTKYNGSKKALEANEESFKYMEQKFNVGMINSIEYNTSKNKLTKAKSDLLQAKFEFLFKKSILDFYSGKPIKISQ